MTVTVGDIERQGNNLAQMIAEKLPQASYLRDSQTQILAPWRPALRDSADDVCASWARAAGMAIDALHNSGWMAGGVSQASVDSIGDGLVLNAQPDTDVLGWSDDFRAQWCSKVESRWEAWSNNPIECDIRGRSTIGQMTDAMVKWYYGYGEGMAWLQQVNRPNATSKLKVRPVQPHRVPIETDPSIRLHQGVHVDENGMAIGYRYKQRSQWGDDVNVDIPVFDKTWRRQIIHVFDGDPTQVRGITPLAPVLKVLRQYDQLSDATLTTALLQTVLAATITSPQFPDDVFGALNGDEDDPLGDAAGFMAAKMDWASRTHINLGEHGKVVSLFPGEKLEMNGADAPGDNYEGFVLNLLREIARCMGITYESLTQDFTRATYSSTRMGVSTMWPMALRRRKRIGVPFVQAIYEQWLAEEIITNRIAFPGGYKEFLKFKAEAVRAKWNGPAKPSADDFKSAKAVTERLENGTSTITHELAEAGLDIETMISQQVRELNLFRANGLQHPIERKQLEYAKTGSVYEQELDGDLNG